MAALLKLSNIDKTYYLSKNQYQHVLKGMSAEFESGQLVALLGESGSGKSTLLNIIGGLDTDYKGSVIVKNKFIRDYNQKEMDDYRKKRIGLIFQNYNLIPHMNVIDNIKIALEMSDEKKQVKEKRAEELLNLVGLTEHAKKYPSQLSGGQKQRVAIARALANNPSIILADEPTGALDKESADLILSILKKIVETGKLVIIVTHSQTVANHCNRIVRIDDGVIVSDVTREEKTKVIEYEKVIMPKPITKKQLFMLSLKNLIQKLSRTSLVAVGISIGIAAFILILALSSGLTEYIQTEYKDDLASNQLTAYYDEYGVISNTTLSEIRSIEGVQSVINSNYLFDATYSINQGTTGKIYQLGAYYSNFYPQMLYGSISDRNGYAIINQTTAIAITENTIIEAIGMELTLKVNSKEYTYTITGIFEDNSNDQQKSKVMVSNTDLKTMNSSSSSNVLYITLSDVTYVNVVTDDLNSLGFSIYQSDTTVSILLDYIDVGTNVLTGLSGLSMIVSAIMIFVVIYISIIERTKEIGILRAIGARKRDIKYMILFEALMIGLLGGIIAVALSLTATLVANLFTNISMNTQLISLNFVYYLLGIFLSVLISVISGFIPAIKASNFDPVEALRYE